jgi:hypothetical protein
MEGILKQLKKQRANLVKASEKRDEYYSKRKEQWQDSAPGVIYECKTNELSEVIEKLDGGISELRTYLNDC